MRGPTCSFWANLTASSRKVFAESQLYDHSQGSDASIPWYASDAGYGFVWNLPSYGTVGLGRIVASCHRSPVLYQIREHIRCLYF